MAVDRCCHYRVASDLALGATPAKMEVLHTNMTMPPIPDPDTGISLTQFLEERDLDREFRVPASDQKGHNERFQFRAPSAMLRQLDIVVRHGGLPYRFPAEVVRHALLRHYKWLESISPVPSVSSQLAAIMEVVQDEEFASEFQVMFNKVAERVNARMGEGDAVGARGLLYRIWSHIEEMPHGEWKEKYMTEFKKRFGHIITVER